MEKDGFSSPLSSDAWNITLLPTSSDFYLGFPSTQKKLLQFNHESQVNIFF